MKYVIIMEYMEYISLWIQVFSQNEPAETSAEGRLGANFGW
jgi:hypothetical protein